MICPPSELYHIIGKVANICMHSSLPSAGMHRRVTVLVLCVCVCVCVNSSVNIVRFYIPSKAHTAFV